MSLGFRNFRNLALAALLGGFSASGGAADELSAEQIEFFEKRVRPTLVERCYECHSEQAKKLRGGLRLDSKSGVIQGGSSGAVIAPGDPDKSPLIQAVRRIDPDSAMPPKTKLSAEEVAALEQWVKMGAPDPREETGTAKPKPTIDWEKARQWWSFQPVRKPSASKVKLARWPAGDVDRFLLARMEKAGLKPASDADKRTLIRRATFDLTGLPPTPGEINAFLADDSPDAFAKVVDRLLNSPRYGERWGRHWLDVVRYADTAGDNSDFPIPQMYRYRNWVIDAVNRDLPYDEFVRRQLAGDLMPAKSEEERHERLIATGYIANARRFGSRVSDYPQHLTIEDTIDNLGRAFLGLSVSCARCHDHKFDPITAEDYYSLYGIFHSTRYPWPGIELEQKQRDLVPLVSKEEVEAKTKEHQQKLDELNANVKRIEAEAKEAKDEKKKELEKALAEAKKSVEKHKLTPLPFEQAYAVAEGKKIEDVKVQLKGDPAKEGPLVKRGFLTALEGGKLPEEDKTSGRLSLAKWIACGENPLAARVMVNRIWLHHFGKGLVPTPNDFGRQGKAPTHPELLDYLAARFVEGGWSVKSMHRLIMLSRTYRLASHRDPEAIERDPGNELLASFPRRRLDAESIRDAMLALGGSLDLQTAGAHPFPPQTEWKFTQHNPFKAVYDTRKRSVYLMTQRIQRHPYLAIFDGADPAASVAFRTASTTPVQALYLLNNEFVHEQSRLFAERLIARAGSDLDRLQAAYEVALGRLPSEKELRNGAEFLEKVRGNLKSNGRADAAEAEAWQALARVLFRLNEFVYVD